MAKLNTMLKALPLDKKTRMKIIFENAISYHNGSWQYLRNDVIQYMLSTSFCRVFNTTMFRKVKKKTEGYVKLPEVVGVFPYRKL